MCKRMMASVVMAATIFAASGFALAAGVGRVSAVPIGPALMFRSGGGGGGGDAVSAGRTQVQPKVSMEPSEYKGREAVETGKLPESKEIPEERGKR